MCRLGVVDLICIDSVSALIPRFEIEDPFRLLSISPADSILQSSKMGIIPEGDKLCVHTTLLQTPLVGLHWDALPQDINPFVFAKEYNIHPDILSTSNAPFNYKGFNLICAVFALARIWLKIVCSTLLPCKHTTDVTRERVVPVYRLMKGLPVNVGAILKQNMIKFRTNKRWCFCYGSIITRYLRDLRIEEEVHDVCRLVDVTRTKAHDPSQGPVLTAIDRQVCNDSWMENLFGMAELQLRIGGRPVTEDEMATLAEHYPLTDSAMYLCRIGPAFQEPIDDDDDTADEENGSDEDASDDTGPGDGDTDATDGDGVAVSMSMDFATNMATC
ncbi:hypothetical protein MTR67_034659 [Solanum verrucosum]|uniref:Putative plant transposon protein domain-containing protein n=1 Tax=Solanum verrucosum TaxID=315347 RepID=A0AAF0U8R8_SOLVR|nr:hypothetical protein MTR67_034659 [Solanum verrucosum]